MKVVDKEQERIDYENSPAGKRKQWLGLLAALVFFLVAAFLYRMFPNLEIGGGKPYVIVMDGLEIIPGKTTVQDLANAGYELTDMTGKVMLNERGEDGEIIYRYRNVYDLTSEADARSMYSSLILVKDEEQAALISIVNNETSAVPLTQCIVSNITIYNHYIDSDKVTVEGTSLPQLTEGMLTELYGKPDRNYDNSLTWDKGNYYLSLKIAEDGTVESLSTNKIYKTDALEKYQN
ncbi:MAG: hypothetical protein J1F18_08410 [Lachnospiraceae bacterium]|nr:hypothetical protein [Lachnospiraceae bacterium]